MNVFETLNKKVISTIDTGIIFGIVCDFVGVKDVSSEVD